MRSLLFWFTILTTPQRLFFVLGVIILLFAASR